MPGVGYLEMARAVHSRTAPTRLSDVSFLRPLILDLSQSDSWVELRVQGASLAFEIVSGIMGSSQLEYAIVHSTGDAMSEGEIYPHSLPALPGQLDDCGEEVNASTVYTGAALAGVEYGPDFHIIQQLWMSVRSRTAASRLRERVDLQGTQVHPTDLDAALQLNQVALFWGSTGEQAVKTMLPFVLNSATLQGPCRGELWVRMLSLSPRPH